MGNLAASGSLTVGNGTPAPPTSRCSGNNAAGNFHFQNDGAGGTLVTDPPVSAATDSNPLALLRTLH
jgi:hypothetical protein